MGQDEHHGVVAGNLFANGAGFANTLGASAPLIRERAGPNSRVGTGEKGVNVFDFAGFGVVHFASDGRVVLDGLREQGSLVGPGVKTET